MSKLLIVDDEQNIREVNKEHKRNIAGTGLGVSIVKNILIMHNAEYGALSNINKGSTFYFELKKENAK